MPPCPRLRRGKRPLKGPGFCTKRVTLRASPSLRTIGIQSLQGWRGRQPLRSAFPFDPRSRIGTPGDFVSGLVLCLTLSVFGGLTLAFPSYSVSHRSHVLQLKRPGASYSELSQPELRAIQIPKSILPHLNYRFNAIPIKISASYFVDIEKLILNFKWRGKRLGTANTTLKGKNKVEWPDSA